MTIKHTPGPWRVGRTAGPWSTVLSGNGDPVADVAPRIHKAGNSNLIAAAPDLLAACEAAEANHDAAMHCARPPMPPMQLTAMLRAVIAKARGGR